METTKSEKTTLELILTLFFIYLIGAGVTIFGYSMLEGHGVLNNLSLGISIFSLSIIFIFSFVGGFLKRYSVAYGLITAAVLNLTALPIIIYTAPVHAVAIQFSQKTNFNYLYIYAIYVALQFCLFGAGLALSRLVNFDKFKNKDLFLK